MTPDPGGAEDSQDLRTLTLIRRVVARRMTAALAIPAVTLHREARFGRLLELRQALGGQLSATPGVDVLLAVLAARSLASYDLLNGSWVDDPPAVRVHPGRNVAVAVETAQGLTVVVLREADKLSIEELAQNHRAMVERARSGRSSAGDVAGGTFTISNLGALGIEVFSPIITPPQAAVLGVGAIRPLPAADRPATLSLTFDHRVVDGAYAARFLGDLIDRIEAASMEER